MIRRLGLRFAAFFRATTPDPFVLAVLLTLVVFALAATIEGSSPLQILDAWMGPTGFFSLLQFGMQMVLILVTGHALASSPLVSAALRACARLPRSGAQAAALVSAVAIGTALLNWGLGLVVGALLAREVGRSCERRGVRAHYPLLAASGYTGLMCWHGGLSGSAPLMMTTPDNVAKFLGDELAAEVGTLPFTSTVLSASNVLVTGGLLLIVPLLCAAMAPGDADPVQTIADADVDRAAAPAADAEAQTVPEKLERSPVTMTLIVVPLTGAVAAWWWRSGIDELDPNALNLMFLSAGLILHGSLSRYAAAITDAARGAAGIVLQFPFYGGIMGVMRGTGLGATIATSITRVATPKMYAALTMASAGLINLFVPSGGGQWAVQGPIAVSASRSLEVPLDLAVMAVAYGDQLTNMLQPFWALPLLAITGVKAREIIGYTAVVMIAGVIWVGGCLIALSP